MLWVIILSLLVLTYLRSPNVLLSIPVFFYLPFAYRLFFIKGNTNILFWGLLLQWLSVSIQLIYSNLIGMPLNDLFKNTIFPTNLLEYTDYLSITGVYFYTFGIFMAVKRLKVVIDESLWYRYDPKKILLVYVAVSTIISASQIAIWAFPTLVQYFYFFFYIKWGFFLATFITVFKRAPTLRIFMFAIIVVEFVLGLSSFFASNFANILLFSLIALSAITKKISYQKSVLFAILGVSLFHMAILWTASKGTYRSYLNQGQATQTVTVSKEAARAKLLELIVKVDDATYTRAVEELVNRVGYIHYFAAAVRFVPARIPYEEGKIYLSAIGHFLVPRFINPDKEELDDSKHTNQYTGLGLSGKNRATSFSLGSFADAYIDFGPIFMFIPIFLFGYLVGSFFKYLYRPNLWGLIFTGPFFLLINIFGADTTKALGFLLIYFVVMAVLNKRLVKFLDPMMRQNVI